MRFTAFIRFTIFPDRFSPLKLIIGKTQNVKAENMFIVN